MSPELNRKWGTALVSAFESCLSGMTATRPDRLPRRPVLEPFSFLLCSAPEGRGGPESDLLSSQRLFTVLRNSRVGLGIRLPQLFLQKWARKAEESCVGPGVCEQDSSP